ncbi:MAG: M24 family metallopeptidase [Candidatus Lokiarchaeota archaeon]|nr:M24 family metallopeptidase [Candidatus Lokiarchaeota archaeon]MBD3200880.1 M24 family metallopeptidase [Candidatus Lokiarchaeota archaeon]
MNLPKPIKTPPDKEELRDRLEKLRNLMKNNDLDYYISFDPTNIYYLTNFANYVHERPFILIIPKKGLMKFVIPVLEATHVKTRARCELELHQYFEYPAPQGENWYDIYKSIIKKDARVGVESSMTLRIYDKTPGNKIKKDLIDELRLIKSEYEIGRLVHACKIINRGHKRLLKICRPGKMLFEIYSDISGYMTAKVVGDIKNLNPMVSKAQAVVLPPSVSHDPHNMTDVFLKMEQGGPHVSGVGGQIDGYGVELERTFFLGSVPKEAEKPFNIMMKARNKAFEMAIPGAIMGDIDREVRILIKDEGFERNLLHRTGHGLGITGHEAPFLAEGYEQQLEPGMVISIEPGIYIPNLGGFRHSDTVLITEEGNISLTKAPDKLEELTINLN